MSEDILIELALRTPEAERGALLEIACAGNPELRKRVESQLQASLPPSQKQSKLEETTGFIATASYVEEDAPGIVIAGRYKLIEQIGEGGMGEVWMAQQSEPVKRLVAIKLIKAGMDSKAVLARFEAERQALAMMDHPNIAKVLDGGIDSDPLTPSPFRQKGEGRRQGRPFFVMELVKGTPITKYCDEHKLSLEERLALFVLVCQAIQHAHQKGIIHRDIKPSNVLITTYDDRPVPKVIDFGVAKATGMQLTDLSINTGFGVIVGTPEYMSPEQASMNNVDIDTRSDVYALGVLLYELLTGTTPVDKKSLREAAVMEVLRIIREDEPPRPSTKLSSSEALPSIAANRHSEATKLPNLIRGDLDWIVMKALEKERARRYETVNGFAADINRYLNGETVLAHPPSAGYKLRKFVRKHRGPVIAACLVALALIGGIIGTILGLIEARNSAIAERKAREAESVANAQAQKRLEQINQGNGLITGIFADLDIREIKKGNKPIEAVLADRLITAAGQLEGESVGDPLVVAELQNRLGLSLISLGFAQEAIPLVVKSRATRAARLGADHLDTLASMKTLAKGYKDAGKLELAVPLFEETLKLRKTKLGHDHPDTLTSMNDLAGGYWASGKLDLALPLFDETLKLRKTALGIDHTDTHESMNNLAVGNQSVGKLDLALPLFVETLKLRKAKLGPDHPDVLTSMFNLAVCHWAGGKLDLAMPLFEETAKLRKAKLGPDHPDTLESMNSLAMGYEDMGKLDRALPLFEETLRLRKSKLGLDHPDTLGSMNNLAAAYHHAGKLDLALPLFEETLKLTKAKLGPDHPDTLSGMNGLAVVYQSAGKIALALPLFEETLKIIKAKLGDDHPNTLTSMSNLAEGYKLAGQHDKALPLYQETLKLRKSKLGDDHPDTLVSLNNLAVGYQAAGKLVHSLPYYEEAFTLMKAKLGTDHPKTLNSMNNLGNAYCDAKQSEKALPIYTELVARQRKRFPKDSTDLTNTLSSIGAHLLRSGQFSPAEEYLHECVSILEKKEPDDWNTSGTQSQLGGALLGQKKYAVAEPLLLKGYQGLKARTPGVDAAKLSYQSQLADSVDRLIQLYTETNRPEEVKKWQAERDKISKNGVTLTPDRPHPR